MKKQQTDFINNLGIGVFIFLSILEFCGLIEYLLRNIFIITKIESKLILWLPEILSLIIFSIILIWLKIKINKQTEIDTRKVLVWSIIIFFGIILLQYVFTYYGTSYFLDNYVEEFELFHYARKGYYELHGYIAYIPILKYLLFGFILLFNEKTVANNV